MDQPPLDHHYIVRHLGGDKRVERRRDGPSIAAVVECGSLTIVPAGTQFQWHTVGPIEFAHLYVPPVLLARTATRFDRVRTYSLVDSIGARDPLLEALYDAMLRELQRPRVASEMYLECLLESLMLTLLCNHASTALRDPQPRETLATYRLKRVVDYVESHLGTRMTLNDLAEVAGGSVFHFSRAFKNSVGNAPYQYVLQRRIERAKAMLLTSQLPLADVARACGFQVVANFSRAFSRLVGTTPTLYRRR